MKKIIIVLMAAVLIAGCTGQGTTTATGTGLAMTGFTSDTASQTGGRDVRLFLDVENTGESTIRWDQTMLYLNGPIGPDAKLQWQLGSGEKKNQQLTRNLDPYDPIKDLPAGKETLRWTLTAPTLEAGQQKTDTFTARAYYNYQTRAVGEIVSYSEAESVAAKQRGEALQTSQFITTAGPLSVTVKSIPDPVTIVKDTETMTLQIVVENVGGGTIYQNDSISYVSDNPPQLQYEDLNKLNLYVDVGSDLQSSVSGDCSGGQELIGGKPTTLTCDVEIPIPPAGKKVYPVKIAFDYGYYVDSTIQLTAVGR